MMNMERFEVPHEQQERADKENPAEAYEEYLLLLQQRNRLLKKLKEKDEKQLDLERREQGFSLYLNGANVDLQVSGHHRSRKSRTAGERSSRNANLSDAERYLKPRTAPSKPKRKGWNQEPAEKIKIRTQKGDKVTVDLPDIYSGKYSEDFEVYQSFLEGKLQEEEKSGDVDDVDGNDDNNKYDDDDNNEDDDIDEDLQFLKHKQEEDGESSDSESEGEEDFAQLTFTVHDIKALRKSLENDTSIRKSIASVTEELDVVGSDDDKNNTGYGLEEIEEEVVEISNDSLSENEIVEEIDDDNSQTVKVEEEPEENKTIFQLDEDDSPLQLIGAAPKSRPISASRKRVEHDNNLRASKDILAAIEEENKKLEEYKGKREIHSAPTKQPSLAYAQKESGEITHEQRPQTVGEALSENDIQNITEKVRKMTGRQQRKLLALLSEIEAVDNPPVQDWNKKQEKTEQFLQQEKNDRIIEKELEKPSIPSKLFDKQDMKTVTSEKTTQHLQLLFEFSSNWGNDVLIGLTEIQFKDIHNKIVKVESKNLKMISSNETNESISNLIKQKTKTTKERHMWKCLINPNESLKISICLQNIQWNEVSEIFVWNYNKSLHDLNIGVKDCKIFLDDNIIWEGVIDKGCGNQIFDYSKCITINKLEVQPKDIEVKESFREKQINKVDKPITSPMSPKSFTFTSPKNSPKIRSEVTSPDNISTKIETELSEQRKIKSSSERVRSTTPSGKPVWLEDSVKAKPDTKVSSDIIDMKPRSRPSSGRRSRLANDNDPLSPRTAQRSKTLSPEFSDNEKSKEIDELFDLNSKPKRPRSGRRSAAMSPIPKEDKSLNVPVESSLSGRQSPLLIDLPSKDENTKTVKSERQKFKEIMDQNLEQSLQSIDNFKFHHLGRITATLDQDEDFGSFLEPIREKDKHLLEDKLNEDLSLELDDETDHGSGSPLFELPVLPHGQELIINIKTTWGDKHYVGLNGIEVFSGTGELVPIKRIQANPSNINILPEYDGDPRVVENLIDGCYLTRDDMHLWLAPFSPGGDHFVELQFEHEVVVAMIRIWNYNKSRIHSTRGACFVEMALDGKLVFIGEIARASGVLSSEDPYGDTILFTTDEDILEKVASNDFTYEVEDDLNEEDLLAASGDFNQRPNTANREENTRIGRPFTCPKSRESVSDRSSESPDFEVDGPIEKIDLSPRSSASEDGFMECSELIIYFLATWGDPFYLGLTGLEVLGETFERIPISLDMMEASPRDLNDLDDYDDDDRTLDKIVNDINVTMSDENMWLIPFNEEEGSHLLRIKFNEPCVVTGIRVWNYNKSPDDTTRGARLISIFLDDQEVSPKDGYLLRKAPGHCHFDFAQDILFNIPDTSEHDFPESSRMRKINLQKIVNEYETLMMPTGFVFQLKIFSSWGDPYYVGLNGMEIYDKNGDLIQLSDNNITAYPHSVNVLSGIDDDVRTPDKLINGINDTYDGANMWLSPILPGQPNVVYMVFDVPVTISMIKIWNYSKTPIRGVRNFGLLVDDLLVYSGVLPQCALYARAILPGLQVPVTHHTILFSDAEDIAIKEKKHLLSSSLTMQEQNIQLTNDNAVLQTYQDKNSSKAAAADPALRPATSVKSNGKFRR